MAHVTIDATRNKQTPTVLFESQGTQNKDHTQGTPSCSVNAHMTMHSILRTESKPLVVPMQFPPEAAPGLGGWRGLQLPPSTCSDVTQTDGNRQKS